VRRDEALRASAYDVVLAVAASPEPVELPESLEDPPLEPEDPPLEPEPPSELVCVVVG
jgi:hypothetical protein